MKAGTYGISGAIQRRPRVSGPSVMALSQNDQQGALSLAGSAASQQVQRDASNQQMAQESKAGAAQLGSMAGGAIGTIWGPAGTMIGSTLGGMVGGLFG